MENDVRIYQNVTIGLACLISNSNATFRIKKGACICAGAKILAKDEIVVGQNTIIWANSVLLSSTGDNETLSLIHI